MQKYEDNLASQLGGGPLVPLSGVTVSVTDQATGLPATLYSDNGVTQITAPIVSDDNGHFAFYAADGRYTVSFTSPRIVTFTRDVILEDPKDNPFATLAQLAAPTGSSNIGNGTETVADSFNALQLADYTALRAYAGPRKSVYVTGYLSTAAPSGIAGMFVRDDSDTTTADDGGNVIVAANGKRWKRQTVRVNVVQYMTDAERADFYSNSPVLDHARAFNAAIAALNGYGQVDAPAGGTYLLKSTVNLGASNSIDSQVTIEFTPGVLTKATLVNPTDVAFSMKNVPGHFNNQGIKNLRLYSTNGNGYGVKFSGQCFGGLDNFYIENFNVGLFFSNAGTGVFNEFIRFNRGELHLNNRPFQMDKDGGDQVSMHGIAFNDVTMNIGSGQHGPKFSNVNWYDANFTWRIFAADGHADILSMDCNGANLGVFGSGSISCEGPPSGPAIITGTGRFWFNGTTNFMSGVTDNLAPVNAWELGFNCVNYIKLQSYGSSGFSVNELRQKSNTGPSGFNGPYGSLARLTATNVESIIANCFAAHATNAGNGFYTGYTGYQQGYGNGNLGWFLASDGTQLKSYAPNGTSISVNHGANSNPYGNNQCYSMKDGQFFIGSAKWCAGSGSPVATSVPGSSGDVYSSRLSDGTAGLWTNKSGTWYPVFAPTSKPSITGSRGGNAALASLLTNLASLGLITDSTTA